MKKQLKHFIYLILLILVDQITKILAVKFLKDREGISIIPKVLKLQYHENNGAVWGILSGQIIFLIVVTIIILSGIIYLYLNIPNTKKFNYLKLICVFISAGAVGNLIDRILYNYVVDFIYFELINFPIFNIADSYVSVSAVVLILLSFFYYSEEDFIFIDSLFKIRKKSNE